ncbi:MAG: hypothetical protein ACYDEC_02550 [Bacteroidia bacterium]
MKKQIQIQNNHPSLISPKGRRTLIMLLLILSPLFWRGAGGEVQAQDDGGQKWSTYGNKLGQTDDGSGDRVSNRAKFLGSLDSFPLIFKTNNVQQMRLGTNGAFQLKSLIGAGNRLLQADANGNINPLIMGTSTQYLAGDGSWRVFPPIPPFLWTQVPNGINYTGNVGINNPTPAVALDVIGDVQVSNNLYVNGGVIIGNHVSVASIAASREIATSKLKADTIRTDAASIAIADHINAIRDVNVGGKINTIGSINVGSALAVSGNATFSGGIDAQNITFKGTTAGMGYVLPGNPIPTATLNAGNLVLAANTNVWGGLNVASLAGGSGLNQLYVDSFGNLSLGNNSNQRPVNPNTSIPACSTGNPAWLLGGNTMINKWGGTISGAFIGTCDASDFVMKTLGIERMRITAAGNVYVDIAYPKYTPFGNALFTVNGQMVAKDLFVEVTDWSDYVFKKDYKLIPLPEVEKYINEHGHLKNIPNAKEVETNGQNVGKLQVLQMEKIEELTLYVIEVNKKVEKLEKIEKENEALKKENKELKKKVTK